MKSLRNTLIPALLILLMVPGFLKAQTTAAVRGKIIDPATGETMPSATVLLIDANQKKMGKISKKDGSFEFPAVEAGSYTIRVNYVGYKIFTTKITVEAGKDITQEVKMQTDVMGLDEVVVTGEAEHRYKSDAQVSVSRINVMKQQEVSSNQDIFQLLTGKTPGVQVSPSSGSAGSGVRFDVRSGAGLFGSGQPVIYVDGIRTANGEVGDGSSLTGGQSFSALDIIPEDVEDIQILKGPAAAALYGTSGSNGVVLITTRHSTTSEAAGSNFMYKVTKGWNEQAEKYTADNGLSFDAANSIFRKGPFTEHALSANGSTPMFSYFASYNRRTEDGITLNNDFVRNSFRVNFSASPSEQVTINTSANLVNTNASLPQNDNNILGFLGETVLFGPTSVGGYGPYALADSTLVRGVTVTNDMQRILASGEIIYKPITDLSLRAVVGYDGFGSRIDQTYPANLDYSGFGITNGKRFVENQTVGRLNFDLSGSLEWRPADDLNASTTLGAQLYQLTTHDNSITKEDFPTQLVTNVDAGAKFDGATETFRNTREAGLFLIQDFSYEGAYLLSLGVRNDYASTIGANAPSIFYPKVSGAIRFDKLGLLSPDFDLFKLRAAYGQSGVLPGPLDGSGLLWSAAPSGSGRGAIINFIGNENIEPERINEIEIGFDIGYLNRYELELTYFMQKAHNSIVTFTNAPSTGLTASTTPANVGSIEGSGFEALLKGRLFQTKDYQLDLSLIWSYATNTVTSLGGAPPIFVNQNAIIEGQPRAAFYTYAVREALFDPVTKAYAGPKIDTARSFLGNPIAPTHTSFSLSFKFLHDFTFSALIDAQFGGTIYNNTRTYQAIFSNDKEYNLLGRQLGVVSDSTVKSLTPGSAEYIAAANKYASLATDQPGATAYFESSDFIRLRELGLRYDFTNMLSDILPNKQIKSLALNIAVRNVLWLMKKFSGPDPEVSSFGSALSVNRGTDFLTLQNPRTLYATLSIGF